MAQKIFIDTDCGIDDAVAIMLALSSPEEVEIAGISCVAGNTSLDNVVKNVCGLLSFFDRTDIPVYKGCSTSFLRNPHRADHIHGSNGLGGVELNQGAKSADKLDAVSGLLESAKANPGLKLVTLGPLTNIAVAFNLHPGLNSLVSEIIIMGGAIGDGNVTPFAEFNFFFDPESIAYCLGINLPIRILTWDATLSVTLTEEEYKGLGMSGTPSADLFTDVQRFYFDFREKVSGKRVINFSDPLTMACVIDPEVAAESETMHLRMNLTREDNKRGASIRVSDTDEADGTAEVIMKCNRERFLKLIKRIKENTPC